MEQKGSILTTLLLLVVIVGGLAYYFLVFRKSTQFIPQSSSEVGCVYPIRVQGNSMEPTLKSGSLISFNSCIADKTNLEIDKIIVFDEGRVKRIGRIKEIVSVEGEVFYKISRDNREGEEFTVHANSVIATQ